MRARLPAAIDGRRNAGIVPKRSRWNDDLSAAPRRMRKRRAARAAERRREAPRLGIVEPLHVILAGGLSGTSLNAAIRGLTLIAQAAAKQLEAFLPTRGGRS
jgi:hypothetical protein